MGAVTSGRDFLQQLADNGRRLIEVALFFKALKSGRRLANLISVNLNVVRLMKSRLYDPFGEIEELSGFDIYAGDGHFHEAACHDPHKPEMSNPGGGGAMLRRVTYTDAKVTSYKYLTTEMRLPAWVIVLLFKQRWDIEKVFDEVKTRCSSASPGRAATRPRRCMRTSSA